MHDDLCICAHCYKRPDEIDAAFDKLWETPESTIPPAAGSSAASLRTTPPPLPKNPWRPLAEFAELRAADSKAGAAQNLEVTRRHLESALASLDRAVAILEGRGGK